jgi:transposase-like protein
MGIFKDRYFTYEVIIWAVRWYCKFGISYRDLVEMLLERGVSVDHSTIYRWVQSYAPKMLDKLKWYWKPQLGYSWRVDETYIRVKGE